MDDELLVWAEARREAILQDTQALSANLPLKFLRQQTHYTTPASNYRLVEKAASRGFAPVEKILAKYQITLDDLAQTLEVPLNAIEELLNNDPHAPLVMVDGEDAQALDDDVVLEGRKNAIRVFREADWGPTLRFYRPSGLRLPYSAGDLFNVLIRAGEGLPPEAYPIDGIIFPKIEQPNELDWVCEFCEKLESRLDLPPNRIRVQLLIESGWALANLAELVRRSNSRLSGIIFGIADYAADLALPEIRFDHPVCDWARAQIVNAAGAIGVPAIDAMTVNYPVADPSLSASDNRQRILTRLKECYDDTQHGINLGMKGKWVGHPAQLFVTLLAYRTQLSSQTIEDEISKIASYQEAVQDKIGATIIDGVMSDRATDRHARARLREAVALGLLPPDDGLALGIVTHEEVASLGGIAFSRDRS